MEKRLLFILCLSLAGVTVSAQTRTVTNKDLEKFKQKRVQAETDLRENYAKLGFPSPEELEKQNVESRRRLSELARRLEAEKIEREKNEVLRRQAEAVEAQTIYLQAPAQDRVFYEPNYFGGGYVFPLGNFVFRWRNRSRRFGQSPYRDRYTQLNVPPPSIQTLPTRTRPPVFIQAAPRGRGGRRN